MNNYIEDFSKIKGNKYSKEESEKLFIGLLFYMINDRSVFKSNPDIKGFILQVFKYDYKDYLYKARPQLCSRLMNDIRKDKSYGEVLQINKEIIKYLKNNFEEPLEKNKQKYKKDNTNLSGWLGIKSRGLNE